MTVLDLLSTLGSLPLSGERSFKEALQTIAGQENVFTYRRWLEGLGHVNTDRGGGKIEVFAPRLVALPREELGVCVAVLTGARNADLLGELEYLSTSHKITIERDDLGNGFPERITLRGSANMLKSVAGTCASLPVEIADDLSIPDAWRLLSSAPSLQSVIQEITGGQIGIARGEPQASAEVFNPVTGYYDRWSRFRESYPSYFALWKKEAYDYRLFWWQADEQDETKSAWIQRLSPLELESFWGRWAVAYSARAAEALPSISGDGTYKVPRLTPLPMELHRVCCLCSGFPPEECDGNYIYRDVPTVIQQGVNDRLRVDNP